MPTFSNSENDSESNSDDNEVWTVIDDSSDQDSTVESDEDDVRETMVLHSRLSKAGRKLGCLNLPPKLQTQGYFSKRFSIVNL